MRKVVQRWIGLLVLVTSAAHAGSGEGLSVRDDYQEWEGLRGRLTFGTVAPVRNDLISADTEALRINSQSLLGDYYLSRPWLGTGGGLRATSGLLLGGRATSWSSPLSVDARGASAGHADGTSDTTATLPYLGVGYTGFSSKGGWGLSADLGLMALNPGSATRLGTRSLDETMRDLRFSPLVQVGLSYSF